MKIRTSVIITIVATIFSCSACSYAQSDAQSGVQSDSVVQSDSQSATQSDSISGMQAESSTATTDSTLTVGDFVKENRFKDENYEGGYRVTYNYDMPDTKILKEKGFTQRGKKWVNAESSVTVEKNVDPEDEMGNCLIVSFSTASKANEFFKTAGAIGLLDIDPMGNPMKNMYVSSHMDYAVYVRLDGKKVCIGME